MAGPIAVDDVAGEFDDLDFLDMVADSEEEALAIPEKADPEKADPEKADPEKADPEKADPEKADPEKADPEKADPEKADPEKADPEKGEQAEIETVAQLAEAMGTTPEEVLANIKHTVKVGDEERELSLADLTARYEEGEGLTQQAEQLTVEQQSFQETSVQQQENADAYANSLLQLYTNLGAEADEQMKAPELVALKAEDPAAYVLKVDEIRVFKENIGKAQDGLVQQYNEYIN